MLPIREIAQHLDFTPNYYSAVENGKAVLAQDKLTQLCQLFKLTTDETAELQGLRDVARRPRWTSEYSQILTDELAQFFGLEHGASRIRSYEGGVIPGLLQTDEYAEALIRDDPDAPATRLPLRIKLRHQRQQRLFDDDPLHLDVIVSQAAVMQQVGGAAVLRDQLLHVVKLIDQLPGNLQFRVVPFTASPRGMVSASTVHLLDFPSAFLPTLAWREAITTLGISDDPDLVDLLDTHFKRASEATLSREETVSLLRAETSRLEGG